MSGHKPLPSTVLEPYQFPKRLTHLLLLLDFNASTSGEARLTSGLVSMWRSYATPSSSIGYWASPWIVEPSYDDDEDDDDEME